MVLPKLETNRIEAMQEEVMNGVAHVQHKRRRNARILTGGFALIAVLSVATLVGNNIGSGDGGFRVSGTSMNSSIGPELALPGEIAPSAPDLAYEDAAGQVDRSDSLGTKAHREIIRTASLTLVSENVPQDMTAVSALTTDFGGYIEQMNQWDLPTSTGDPSPYDSREMTVYPGYYGSQNMMLVRIPASDLDQFVAELGEIGTVQQLTINQSDVTATVQDIEARIRSLTLSIERLEELIASATTTADLIAAEEQLTSRQGELESYESQREYLSSQVAMSQVQINFTDVPKPAELAPDGFWGGLLTGWNSVIATLGGMIVGLGILLPWIGVLAALWLVVWAIIRIRRGSKQA